MNLESIRVLVVYGGPSGARTRCLKLKTQRKEGFPHHPGLEVHKKVHKYIPLFFSDNITCNTSTKGHFKGPFWPFGYHMLVLYIRVKKTLTDRSLIRTIVDRFFLV